MAIFSTQRISLRGPSEFLERHASIVKKASLCGQFMEATSRRVRYSQLNKSAWHRTYPASKRSFSLSVLNAGDPRLLARRCALKTSPYDKQHPFVCSPHRFVVCHLGPQSLQGSLTLVWLHIPVFCHIGQLKNTSAFPGFPRDPTGQTSPCCALRLAAGRTTRVPRTRAFYRQGTHPLTRPATPRERPPNDQGVAQN